MNVIVLTNQILKAFKILLAVLLLNIIPLIELSSIQYYHAAPTIDIINPYNNSNVFNTPISIYGSVYNFGASTRLTINGTPIIIAENGLFVAAVDVSKGKNILTIIAKSYNLTYINKTLVLNLIKQQ